MTTVKAEGNHHWRTNGRILSADYNHHTKSQLLGNVNCIIWKRLFQKFTASMRVGVLCPNGGLKENGTLLRSVRYDYNEYDQVIQKTETKGTEAPVVTTYEYNSLHLISGLTKDNVYQHTSYNELGLPEQTVMGYTSTDKVDHTVRQDTYVYGMSQSEYAEKELYRHQIAYGSKNETHTYAYDERGNIAQITCNDGSAQTIIKYSYNKANQLIREDNQLADRTWEMTYDEAGNMLSRKAYYYTIDPTPSGEITDERKVFTYGDGG